MRIDDPIRPAVSVIRDVDEPEHPWLKGAGMFKDDPTYDDFLAEIEAYRREVDETEARLATEAWRL